MRKRVHQRRMMTGQKVPVAWIPETSQPTAYSKLTGWEPVYSSVPAPSKTMLRMWVLRTGSMRVQVRVRPAASSQPLR